MYFIIVATLSGTQWLLKITRLTNEHTQEIERVEFYVALLLLIFVSAGFLTRVILYELESIKRW